MGMAWRPLRVRSRRSTSHGCSWLWTKNPPCQPPAGSVSASSSHGPSRRSSIQVCPGAYSIHPVVLTGMLVARAHHKTSQTPMLLPQPIGPTRTSRTGPRQLFAGRQDLRPGDRSRAVTAPPPAQQGNSSVLQSPHQEPTLLRGESLAPPLSFESMVGPVGTVECVEFRNVLVGKREVEDLGVLGDALAVG